MGIVAVTARLLGLSQGSLMLYCEYMGELSR